eukprot:4230964-Amphidinium_carterae.1
MLCIKFQKAHEVVLDAGKLATFATYIIHWRSQDWCHGDMASSNTNEASYVLPLAAHASSLIPVTSDQSTSLPCAT